MKQALLSLILLLFIFDATAQAPEKTKIKIGYVKTLDAAPLIIAKEKNYFKDEGIKVELIPTPNYKVLFNQLCDQEIDATVLQVGQVLSAHTGWEKQADLRITMMMGCGIEAIALHKSVWDDFYKDEKSERSFSAKGLLGFIAQSEYTQNLGICFETAISNYLLRYWLAAANIHPGNYSSTNSRGDEEAKIKLRITPPQNLHDVMEVGFHMGYCGSAPWPQLSHQEEVGVIVAHSNEIAPDLAGQGLTFTNEFIKANPLTTVAINKAIIRGSKFLDEADALEISKLLTPPMFFERNETQLIERIFRDTTENSVRFFNHHTSYPYYSNAIWHLTQMRRWGQIGESKDNTWYTKIAEKAMAPEIWNRAIKQLKKQKHIQKSHIPRTDGYKSPSSSAIDGILFDPKKPVEYLSKFLVGNKK